MAFECSSRDQPTVVSGGFMNSPTSILSNPTTAISCGLHDFRPSDEYRQPSDKWFWQCTDESCYRDLETGYRQPGALCIHRQTKEVTTSFVAAPWANLFEYATGGHFRSQWIYPRLDGACGYEISAMVRTQDVSGQVRLALQFRQPLGDTNSTDAQSFDTLWISETPVQGTRDWTKTTLHVPRPKQPYKTAGLFLEPEGTGQCWFDDVDIKPLTD